MTDKELTCTYTPDVYGENTRTPAEGCMAFLCSECDGAMMYGEGGSWFEVEPPYKPLFSYCPYCGAKVVWRNEPLG